MMSFMMKKKRFKFHVNFCIEELSSVPFVSGILFAKIRLLDGGNFAGQSERQDIINNCVKWKAAFSFQCKMTANANTGSLDECKCRISIRKEQKGGKTYQKLGYKDVDLAEYAGSGCQTKKFLLEGYDSKHRQDNSVLEVTVEMSLVSGDPVFKVPQKSKSVFYRLPGEMMDVQEQEARGIEDCSEGSLASNSSGFDSLPRKDRPAILPVESPPEFDSSHDFEKSHSRNNSYASQHSKTSTGYVSLSHSRQSSIGNENPTHTSEYCKRSPSAGSALINDLIKGDRRKKFEDSMKERRMDSTRVDATGVVDELLNSADLLSSREESSGLQLLVDKDGTTALR
ncbi:protein FAM102A-like isoform X2 [Pecten maximus]|uniref:protein FAM102A-like isoform X2 n=1 Tax=Pecten maximus TaxID=6579 RepID=UPI001458A233|nr:protein FAM102A-like isoform X2 [Pecten maximus]